MPDPLLVIDSHTGGEPTRVIISGAPDLGTGDMASRKVLLQEKHDHIRRALVNEPRGSEVMVGALLCKPRDPQNTAGVIFFNNVGYLHMCGHGMIGLIQTLHHLNRITPGEHHIETPVGLVTAHLHDDARISIQNVPSYRYKKNQTVNVPDIGPITGDIAWGGNWFFLISDHNQTLQLSNVDHLTDHTWKIRKALEAQNITGEDNGLIDHIELFSPPPDPQAADSINFVLCPGKAYDRSPCGTGTSAKVACLAADEKLKENQIWRQQSIVGSIFEASYQIKNNQIIPTITSRAHITAESTIITDPNDPFTWGI